MIDITSRRVPLAGGAIAAALLISGVFILGRNPASSPPKSLQWARSSTRKNVVISMAYGYPLSRFRIFVGSLRQSGYTGDIILFTNFTADPERDRRRGGAADDPRIPAYLRRNSVTFYDAGNSDVQMHPKLWRYKLYDEQVRKEEYASSLILLIDFRDVVFQADPFAFIHLRGEWLRFYEEIFPPTMRQSHYTYEWIRECWGEDVAQKMADAVIVCSGATMGTAKGILHYTHKMAHAMQTAPHPICADHDQRYHNYLLYTGQFERVRQLRAGHAEVYNLGYIGKQNRSRDGLNPTRWRHIADITTRDSEGHVAVLNEDGAIAPVLHQYDRVPWLTEAIEGRFAGRNQ